MPPIERPTDTRLINAYNNASLKILRALQTATPRTRGRALALINSYLSQLDTLTAAYIKEQIPFHFAEGTREAIKKLKTMQFTDVDETFSLIHQEALQVIVDDATFKFANTLQTIRTSARGVLNDLAKRQIIADLAQGEITGEGGQAATVRNTIQKEGITGFRKSNGARITLQNYAATLTRTILAEAHNTGAGTRYISNGVKYGIVIERGDAPDKVCQFMRGKIVSLKDRRLWGPFHPNCMGGISPVMVISEGAIVFESAEDRRIPKYVYFYLSKSRSAFTVGS